jgi:hypothetical protein
MTITYADVIDVRSETEAPRYGRNADGYGAKIPSRHWVRLAGESRWRRVYVMQWANSGSAYVVRSGEDVFLRDTALL